jgi:hypothetical protein
MEPVPEMLNAAPAKVHMLAQPQAKNGGTVFTVCQIFMVQQTGSHGNRCYVVMCPMRHWFGSSSRINTHGAMEPIPANRRRFIC